MITIHARIPVDPWKYGVHKFTSSILDPHIHMLKKVLEYESQHQLPHFYEPVLSR